MASHHRPGRDVASAFPIEKDGQVAQPQGGTGEMGLHQQIGHHRYLPLPPTSSSPLYRGVYDLACSSDWAYLVIRYDFGVTGFLTTILAPDAEQLTELIKQYAKLFDDELPGAEALVIHLEGPFLNVEKKGDQNPDWLRIPSTEEAKAYLEPGKGWIRQMTMAPELPGADKLASLFQRAGVVLAVAHSTAGYEIGREAFEGNWTHVTHTFNTQVGLHHRKPGLIGAILSSDEITLELIADMVHVHPCAIKVLVHCLGTDRVVLITDAMAGAGLPDGNYTLLGHDVMVKDGKATLQDGTIAGSIAVLNQCVRNMVQEVGVPLPQAVKMATLNPARAMGLANLVGSIAVGKEANLAVIDKDINVYLTMIKGRIVYNNL